MSGNVEILVYTDTKELARQVEIGMKNGYSLYGSVTTGINANGNLIYVATMVKDPEVDEVWDNIAGMLKERGSFNV